MKRAIVLFACMILLVASADAQRRLIGNSGRGGSLSEPQRAEKPARTEQTQQSAPPSPAPPPVRPHPCLPPPSPVCGSVTIVAEPIVALVSIEERTGGDKDDLEHQAVLHDCATHPELSGFDFSAEDVVPCHDEAADLYFVVEEEGPQFVVPNDTDIKDAGEGENAVVRFLPDDAWAPNHRVPVLADHHYILWTWDDQRFVVRVAMVGEDRVVIRWEQLAGGPRIAGNLVDRNGERHRAARSIFGR